MAGRGEGTLVAYKTGSRRNTSGGSDGRMCLQSPASSSKHSVARPQAQRRLQTHRPFAAAWLPLCRNPSTSRRHSPPAARRPAQQLGVGWSVGLPSQLVSAWLNADPQASGRLAALVSGSLMLCGAVAASTRGLVSSHARAAALRRRQAGAAAAPHSREQRRPRCSAALQLELGLAGMLALTGEG